MQFDKRGGVLVNTAIHFNKAHHRITNKMY